MPPPDNSLQWAPTHHRSHRMRESGSAFKLTAQRPPQVGAAELKWPQHAVRGNQLIADERRSTSKLFWALGWCAMALGFWVLGPTDSPDLRSPDARVAAVLVASVGWTLMTVAALKGLRARGATVAHLALAAVLWSTGGLLAIVEGFAWMATWDWGLLGPIVAISAGVFLGTTFSLPSASRGLLRALVCVRTAALLAGLLFILQYAGVVASYLLLLFVAKATIVPLIGWTASEAVCWGVPAVLTGLAGARHVDRLLAGWSLSPTF